MSATGIELRPPAIGTGRPRCVAIAAAALVLGLAAGALNVPEPAPAQPPDAPPPPSAPEHVVHESSSYPSRAPA